MDLNENRNLKIENNTAILTLFAEPDLCDMSGAWRPSAVVAAMQLATHYMREALGIGWDTAAAKRAMWVVSRVNAGFNRVPHLGERIILRATPLRPVKFLYPWRFEFSDGSGNILGQGRTLWNLMDSDTRRIAMVPEIAERLKSALPVNQGSEIPEAACELEEAAKKQTVIPVYTDLDINRHVSHLRYIDWCCNALGVQILNQFRIASFRISFMQELRPGEAVDTELRTEGNRFSFSGYLGDNPAFVVDGVLQSRDLN